MNELGERAGDGSGNRSPTGVAGTRSSPSTARRTTSPIAAADRVVLSTITADEAGQRLDNFLVRRAKGVPRSHLHRVIRGGEVRINRGRVGADYRLQEGDLLRMPPMRVAVRETLEPKRERAVDLPIVFEDDELLVVDKPAGVAVHGGSGVSFGVIEQLRHLRADARFLELAHRLDRETSGLLLLAKRRSALTKLHADLRDGRVRKRYLACVAGAWPDAKRDLRAPLVKVTGVDGERRVRVADDRDANAIDAHTVVRPLEAFDGRASRFTLLDVELKTGRTHQIRVHLAHAGRPIVGDDKYGDFAVNHAVARKGHGTAPSLRRMFLHATRLELAHPRTGDALRLEAPLPNDCARFLDALRTSTART